MAASLLVVQGGTLIDGTGRAPVENAVILIESGRFKAIGRTGEIPIPAGAEVIDAAGRTVLPGYIDGHGHLEDFQGELYLHLGITTVATINIFQDGPWTAAQKRGTALGKIRGPRIWMAGRALGGARCETNVDGMWDPRIDRGNIVLHSPEDARREVRRKKERGCDIIKLNEFLPPDLIKIVCEEAHELGMPVIAHSWDAIESAKAGVDSIEHIWAVGNSSVLYPPARERLHEDRLAGKIDQEIAMSYYEPENYGPIIDAMVAHGTAWTPTIAKWLRPLSPSAARFRAREAEILDHPKSNLPGSVRAVTEIAYTKLERYTPEQQERARIGYDKANDFIRRFVEAGGLLKEGADPPRGLAGLLLHEALVMDVEAGVPPMTAIQSVTLNAAKVLKRDRDYGSVEVGKVADLAIIEGDPLADIWAMQNVKVLVMDGKPVDTSFTGYTNPIPAFYPYQSLPSELEIAPNFVLEGSGPITLTVRGAGMWPFHRVMLKREFGSLFNLNAAELPTRYVSKTELEATIAPELLSRAGTYTVTVKAEGEILPESHRAHLIVGFQG
jgi:imidazolonepropionase-like amidohydrolase